MKIQKIHARQILDSRGNPTIEVDVLTNKSIGTAAVPSGASTGSAEALELRDNSKNYGGKSVKKAVNNVNNIISSLLKNHGVDDQRKIDEAMIKKDGTKNKSKLGANAMLGVSLATARAGASAYSMHLHDYIGALYSNKKFVIPMPFANVINGGVHAGNELKFQEFMIVPVKAKTFSEAVKIISEIYHELKKVISESFGPEATGVGDEGGFAPPIKTAEEALELLEVAVEEAGYKGKVAFAIDAAASEFYNEKSKKYDIKGNKLLTSGELEDYYVSLVKKYRIISIEDPFHEQDYEAFISLTRKLGKKVQIVGDDLTVSNSALIKKAAERKMCNALLLKVNQIGTLTEALEAAHLAQKHKWKVMVSHRSGETEDPFIADLAVGISSGQIKLGAPCRGERTSKYNQLLRIEDLYGKDIKFAKW